MKVRFIEKMDFINFTLLNETQIIMYIEPSEMNSANPNLNFTWKCVSIKPKSMEF